jgi:hypothetical protein
MTTDEPTDDDSILANLQGEPITYEVGEAFEATVDRLNRVITYLSGRIADTEGTATTEGLAALSDRRDHYIVARNTLRPEDTERVAQLREECVQILKNEAGY